MTNHKLEDIRQTITAIDEEIIKLLAARRDASVKVAEYKIANDKPVKDLQRELQLMTNLVNKAADQKLNLSNNLITAVYKNIITDSCNYQQEIIIKHHNIYRLNESPSIKVSYLGYPGSYSYIASKKFAGFLSKHAEATGFNDFQSVIDAVTRGQVDFAVLPLENTNSGSINEVYDLLGKTALEVVADLSIDINHVFVAKEIFDEKEIDVIYTHAQPYEQSSFHIRELQPGAEVIFTKSSTHAMQEVKKSTNPRAVAIGNQASAYLYGLNTISENISNNKNNQTRFVVLGKNEVAFNSTIAYKTMLHLITNHTKGALADALEVFKRYNINLTKIESRPILGSPWREFFFVEFEGHLDDINIQRALEELEPICRGLKVLGSFPSFLVTDEIIK